VNLGPFSGGCRAHRPGTLDALAAIRRMQSLPQVIAALHVQPEISAVAEHTRQHRGSIGGYRAPIVAPEHQPPLLVGFRLQSGQALK